MNRQEEILEIVKRSGVTRAVAIVQKDVVYDASFRKLCEQNQCGRYGKCYVCPPDVGEIGILMKKAQEFPRAILYQNVSSIEDSFDIEGMQEASRQNQDCSQFIRSALVKAGIADCLQLTSGGCGLCERCGKLDHVPCLHPKEALSNMESYGIFVSETAKNAGLKYINGSNSVTFFGIVLFKEA